MSNPLPRIESLPLEVSNELFKNGIVRVRVLTNWGFITVRIIHEKQRLTDATRRGMMGRIGGP